MITKVNGIWFGDYYTEASCMTPSDAQLEFNMIGCENQILTLKNNEPRDAIVKRLRDFANQLEKASYKVE